jgi:hypothetical protein
VQAATRTYTNVETLETAGLLIVRNASHWILRSAAKIRIVWLVLPSRKKNKMAADKVKVR